MNVETETIKKNNHSFDFEWLFMELEKRLDPVERTYSIDSALFLATVFVEGAEGTAVVAAAPDAPARSAAAVGAAAAATHDAAGPDI